MQVKEIRDLETWALKGYEVDGSIFVPIDPQNRFYKKVINFIKNGGKVETPTLKERLEYLKQSRFDKINQLADEKLQEAMNYIAGKKVTQYQLQRYEIKYQEAIKALQTDDYSFFEAEAKLLGIEPKDLAKLVKERGDAWKKALNDFTALIEAYRVKAQKVLENDVDTISKIFIFDKYLEEARNLENVTADDLENIFNEIEAELNKKEEA